VRPIDGSEHRRKDLVTVREDGLLVTARRLGSKEHSGVTGKLRSVGRVRALNLQRHLVLGDGEQAADRDQDRDDGDDEFSVTNRSSHGVWLCNFGAATKPSRCN
jgi:hypothetical protein